MAAFVFNIAKGRVAELYNRVKTNDPANSALVLVVLKASGLEADATLRDYDDLGTLLAGTNDEATNVGYARKVLTDADIAALAVDDVNDWMPCDLPDQTWSGVEAAGGSWAKLLVCYDPDTTTGTDSSIVPLTAHDFAVTPEGPDGPEIVAAIDSFYRAL